MKKIKNKFFFILSFLMAFIVIISNYLVQFPVNYLGLENILTYGAFTYPIAFLIAALTLIWVFRQLHSLLIALLSIVIFVIKLPFVFYIPLSASLLLV